MIVKHIAKGLAIGAAGGLAAAWVMNQFQSLLTGIVQGAQKPHGAQSTQNGMPRHGAGAELEKLGLDNEQDNAAERTANIIAAKVFDYELTKNQKHVGGQVTHYVFGATTGALYGAAAEMLPKVSIGTGLAFGAAVWLVADEIIVPAAGLSRSASEYPLSKHAYALASHLVYGATTELLRRVTKTAL